MKSGTRFIFGLMLLLIPVLSYAQGVSGAFQITGKEIVVTEGRLFIELDIRAFHLATSNDASLELFPVLGSGENEKILPGISYRGGRYKDTENREPFFMVYQGIQEDQVLITPYSTNLPYESWMDSASLEFRQYLSKDGRYIKLFAKQMMQNLNIGHLQADTLWSIDRSILSDMVQFLQPQAEALKMRSARSSANIDYPVGKTDILMGHGNNASELRKIANLMDSILTDSLVAIKAITITGYSSPEGSYATNERLSRMRSEGFKEYLTAGYPLKDITVHTNWVAEDWEGVGRLVEVSNNVTEKQKVLDIIHNPEILPDVKDAKLQQVGWWSENDKIILQEMYPQLRRIEVSTDYVVHPLNDKQAKELLYSRPEALSLAEMMRVASFYEPESEQYREVYEIAVKHYPDDIVANNNAAAAVLLEGDTRAASLYLQKTETLNDSRILVNRGVASYIAGDTIKAGKYFTEACHNDIAKGCSNLHLLNSSLYERNKHLTGAQAHYERLGSVNTAEFGAPIFFSITHGGGSASYRFAIKTNLLYDIALLPNVAMEFPFGRRWSMEVEGQWAWWNTKTTHNNCWRIQSVGLEARKWLGDKSLALLTGHYLGLYGMAGTYDVKFRNKNGYLSDMSYSAGISYGYSFPVFRKFNLELGIAAGYLGGKYKVYDQYDSQNNIFPLKEEKDMHYFGPSKAKVSLVWIIGGGEN